MLLCSEQISGSSETAVVDDEYEAVLHSVLEIHYSDLLLCMSCSICPHSSKVDPTNGSQFCFTLNVKPDGQCDPAGRRCCDTFWAKVKLYISEWGHAVAVAPLIPQLVCLCLC
jgi:hypothetical protein